MKTPICALNKENLNEESILELAESIAKLDTNPVAEYIAIMKVRKDGDKFFRDQYIKLRDKKEMILMYKECNEDGSEIKSEFVFGLLEPFDPGYPYPISRMDTFTTGSRCYKNSNRDAYYLKHKCCPKCGSTHLLTTLVGYIGDDRNSAVCDCGWKGIVHDLVEEK
jgi:hypothetical protein